MNNITVYTKPRTQDGQARISLIQHESNTKSNLINAVMLAFRLRTKEQCFAYEFGFNFGG